MSRKHNVKHNRSPSRYKLRLQRRGETNASVRMPTLQSLRNRQTRNAEPVELDEQD